jgi:two-component system nitrate/nitrite response regulator NarL
MQILLADSQPKVRFALRVLLERQPGLEVLGEAAEAKELLALAGRVCPGLVLLDWGLPGQKPGETVASLRRLCPSLAIVVLSGRPELRSAALAAGADDFVSKADPPECLLSALDSVACSPGGVRA